MGIKDKFKKMNPKVPPVILVVVSLLVSAGIVWQLAMPKANDKAALETEYATIQTELESSKVMARNKQKFKEKVEQLDAELKSAQEKLPTTEQMEKLLSNINALTKSSGLKLNNWNIGKPLTDPLKLYTETTVTCDVSGSYHSLGKFMAGIDGMTRLVTVTDMSMSSAKLKKYDMEIPTKFTLIAYSAAGGK